MSSRKLVGTAMMAVALGVAALPLASTAWAASDTSGLVSLVLQGIGRGSIATGDCATVTCAPQHICECLSATYTMVGNQGFGKGSLVLNLSVDVTVAGLPISDVESCYPAAGNAILSNSKGKNTVTMTASGLECPTLSGPNVFDGTYVVTGGTGKYSSSSGGAGSLNGSQEATTGSTGEVAVIGTLQATSP